MQEAVVVPPFLRHYGAGDAASDQRTKPQSQRKSRGRPPGIRPERRQALQEMARSGLTLAEMAAALRVSRQCIHQQLAKCPSISIERQALQQVRRRIERTQRLRERAIQRARKHSAHGASLARFLREAMARGWMGEAAPGRRPRINGVRLGFHTPQRTRASNPASQAKHLSRYYQVKVTHPEWLHVVCLPSNVYVFYFPDPTRRSSSVYIPVSAAHARQLWREWLKLRDRRRPEPIKRAGKPGHTATPAWAA